MNKPENMVPLPDWYSSKALPLLKKMWREYVDKKRSVDIRQADHYNSVLKFTSVKKGLRDEEMSFGEFLFAFFGFRIELEDGTARVPESALENVRKAVNI